MWALGTAVHQLEYADAYVSSLFALDTLISSACEQEQVFELPRAVGERGEDCFASAVAREDETVEVFPTERFHRRVSQVPLAQASKMRRTWIIPGCP